MLSRSRSGFRALHRLFDLHAKTPRHRLVRLPRGWKDNFAESRAQQSPGPQSGGECGQQKTGEQRCRAGGRWGGGTLPHSRKDGRDEHRPPLLHAARWSSPRSTRAASPGQRHSARMIIRSLNPEADIIETSFSNAPLERILNTGRFNFERAQQHPLWFKELYGFADHKPETEEYGVRNFVYRARRPFVPAKFDRFLKESWQGVIRA